jgi:hypothetical protein
MLFVKFSFLYNFGVYYVKDYIVLQLANRYECQERGERRMREC